MKNQISKISIPTIRTLCFCLMITISLSGCEIVGRVYDQAKKDVETHMFPEDIKDQSPPLKTRTYICDSARTLMIYKNEGAGTAVVEFEGRASFLTRVAGAEDEIYKNSQTSLRIRDDEMAELAREQVPILTNCKRQIVQVKKEF